METHESEERSRYDSKSFIELQDDDFENRETEEDRKFNDIMKAGVSLDNQIMC